MRRVLQFLPVLNSVHLSGNFPNGCVTAVVVQRSDHQAGPRASASYRVQSRRRAGIWLAQTSNTPGARSTVSTRSSGQPRMRTVFVERPISMCRCDHRSAARATSQALSPHMSLFDACTHFYRFEYDCPAFPIETRQPALAADDASMAPGWQRGWYAPTGTSIVYRYSCACRSVWWLSTEQPKRW